MDVLMAALLVLTDQYAPIVDGQATCVIAAIFNILSYNLTGLHAAVAATILLYVDGASACTVDAAPAALLSRISDSWLVDSGASHI